MIEVSVIVPTYNERENLPLVLKQLAEVLAGRSYEVIIVDDDSEDGTWQWAQAQAMSQPNLHVIRRIHRRGLNSALLEGLLLGKGQALAVIDADLQHDLKLLPAMLKESATHDLVIGSRYLQAHSIPQWNPARAWMSKLGTRLAAYFLHQEITDPLSGFFMIQRTPLHALAPRLRSEGFKILMEILLHAQNLKMKELPYLFGERRHGTSKLDSRVILDFLDVLLSQTWLAHFNLRFARYGAIGLSGVAIHFAVLTWLYRDWEWAYPLALIFAIELALISNYIWNNQWTFAEQRFLRSRWWRGLLRYNLACSLGTFYNIAIAWYLVAHGESWILSSAFGILVGISWNYLANKHFTWKE